MYKLLLYGLAILVAIGILLGFSDILPMNGTDLIGSLAILMVSAIISNQLFSKAFKIPTNPESVYITTFILFLILPTATNFSSALVLSLASVLAMASKFVLNVYGKHLFNPAAITVVFLGLGSLSFATWWVGSKPLLLPVAIFGFLIIRKIRRYDLFVAFLVGTLISLLFTSLRLDTTFNELLEVAIMSGPLVFFGTVMLTEPLTSPPTRKLRIIYGTLVGLLYGNTFHFGIFNSTPELALALGNIFSYAVSSKFRFVLHFEERIQTAKDTFDFLFSTSQPVYFNPGQYLEWQLSHDQPDSRGVRRYFTIASAPTEKHIRLGVKIPNQPSTFKKALFDLRPGETVLAGQLAGDFQLPKDNSPVVAIAGGVGITPFRSMVQNLIDTNKKTDMILFYLSNTPEEFAYLELFESAQNAGVKFIPIVSAPEKSSRTWQGRTGRITKELIESEVPDFKKRIFYISGPNAMVNAYTTILKSLGIKESHIRKDYFPGY
jgi:glycine betaine catabolism B